jgi:O-antigen chain-terminating methyltransferase
MDSLSAAYTELKNVAGLAQHSTLSLKRAVDALSAGGPNSVEPEQNATRVSTAAAGPDTDAFKYVGFEDRFRGSHEEIRQRLVPYLPLFAGAANVLDAGCGRGELLELFREQGISARGIDINDEMVAECRARGLTAERADALTYLEAQPDGSLGGLAAIQVVEHLEPAYLMRFLETAHHKLAAGAPLVLETINPACWTAFFDSFLRDLTHTRPLHPDTLQYLVQASGFLTSDVRYLSPVSDKDKLPSVTVTPPSDADPTLTDVVETINAHATRLNSRLFTFRDYAIVAHK